jgi:hypothetical protein
MFFPYVLVLPLIELVVTANTLNLQNTPSQPHRK